MKTDAANLIFEDSNRWISANIIYEERQYIFEIQLSAYPTRFGLFSGRIVKLYLYDDQDRLIAEYDRKWIIGPSNGTAAYRIVGKILKQYNFEKKGRKTA